MLLESDTVLEQASALKAQGKLFALLNLVRCEPPTSAKPGAKALVDAEGDIAGWIGGGSAAGSAAAGSAIDPVGGMSGEVATAEFTSDYLGQTYCFCCAGCQHSFEKWPQHDLQSGEGSA